MIVVDIFGVLLVLTVGLWTIIFWVLPIHRQYIHPDRLLDLIHAAWIVTVSLYGSGVWLALRFTGWFDRVDQCPQLAEYCTSMSLWHLVPILSGIVVAAVAYKTPFWIFKPRMPEVLAND